MVTVKFDCEKCGKYSAEHGSCRPERILDIYRQADWFMHEYSEKKYIEIDVKCPDYDGEDVIFNGNGIIEGWGQGITVNITNYYSNYGDIVRLL